MRVANRAQYWTHTAVDGLSLTVVAGDVYAMGGPNRSSCLDSTIPFDDQRLQLVWKEGTDVLDQYNNSPAYFPNRPFIGNYQRTVAHQYAAFAENRNRPLTPNR